MKDIHVEIWFLQFLVDIRDISAKSRVHLKKKKPVARGQSRALTASTKPFSSDSDENTILKRKCCTQKVGDKMFLVKNVDCYGFETRLRIIILGSIFAFAEVIITLTNVKSN